MNPINPNNVPFVAFPPTGGEEDPITTAPRMFDAAAKELPCEYQPPAPLVDNKPGSGGSRPRTANCISHRSGGKKKIIEKGVSLNQRITRNKDAIDHYYGTKKQMRCQGRKHPELNNGYGCQKLKSKAANVRRQSATIDTDYNVVLCADCALLISPRRMPVVVNIVASIQSIAVATSD